MQRHAAAMVEELRRAMELHKTGRLEEAVARYRRLLDYYPDHPDVNHFLGMAEYQRGNLDAAVELIKKAIALQPGTALFHGNLGRIQLNRGEYADAAARFRRAFELSPDDAELPHLLGRALRLDGDAEAALPHLQHACELRPDSVRVLLDFAEALAGTRQNARAAELFRRVLEREPENTDALRSLAHSLRTLNRSDEAIACLDSALALQQTDPKIWCEHGETLEEAGQFEGAAASFNRALQLRPGYPVAVACLLALNKGQGDPELAAAGAQHLQEQRISKPVRVQLHFAMGRHYDAAGEYDLAFEHFRSANDIVAIGRRYRPGDTERRFAALMSVFTPELFRDLHALGHDSRRPLFIVGMPRSGTTLTEQVLSSHRDIAGAGELGYFMQMSYALEKDAGDTAGTFRFVRDLRDDALRPWTQGYLERLDQVSATAARVTDKMPLNFLNLGLMALAFPNARVIHCRRDPLDNCLSCYVENMHQDQRYSTRLKSLGHFYVQYHRLMAHWRTVLPVPILDVGYEELVADFDGQARRLVAFCGLPWDENCNRFYATDRPVTTPSKWQVRQPIYRSSVARWRRYEKHLGPLREALAPLLHS
jgi:Flp pilus assembly protein TadD